MFVDGDFYTALISKLFGNSSFNNGSFKNIIFTYTLDINNSDN